ncbi:MAG: stage 0 sporulation protein J [Chloroflexi bacterium RBG_16_57_11]|nr:MAG: stage 0 sporulation protein J [Chloroflexi bacterium RBG_16_57_11]
MSRRAGLGRGLEALIPGGTPPASGVSQLPVETITPNPRQPRSRFDPDELSELAASILEHGLLQPVIVTQDEDPGRYILVAGERRWLAARQAGLSHIPAILREANDQQRLEMALIENVQRADLAPLEAADAYRQLADDFGLSHEEIAARVGKSRTAVTNTLRLLKLPEAVREALAEGKISEGHARALLALPTSQAQSAALHSIIAHELNVRQTEALVRRLSGERPAPVEKPSPPPEVVDLERRLEDSLGTRVSLNRRSRGHGTLVIHFYSDEELDALIERLLE